MGNLKFKYYEWTVTGNRMKLSSREGMMVSFNLGKKTKTVLSG